MLSISVYAMGRGALAISDLVVGKLFNAAGPSNWAVLRSIIGIHAVLAVAVTTSQVAPLPHSEFP